MRVQIYVKTNSVPKKLITKSNKRIAGNETFNLIEENAKRWKAQQDDQSYPLHYSSYAESKNLRKWKTKNTIPFSKIPSLVFVAMNPSEDVAYIAEQESRAKRNKDWMSGVVKDPYIYEALQIIEDWTN